MNGLHDFLFIRRTTPRTERTIERLDDRIRVNVYSQNQCFTVELSLEDGDLATLPISIVWGRGGAYATVNGSKDASKRPPGYPRSVLLHRVIMERVLGRYLTAEENVDHTKGFTLDNRRTELRLATASQNARNMRSRNGLPPHVQHHHHLSKKPKPYKVTLCLGVFATIEEAESVARAASLYHFGEFSPYYSEGADDETD